MLGVFSSSLRIGAAIRGLFVAIVVVLAGIWTPVPVSASVQLTGFTVTSPPPPEQQPPPRSNPTSLSATTAAGSGDLPTHDATVGTMLGHAGVDGGAATYSVPIVVPPGRAGMQPALSLNYNSRSGSGVMGVGWTMSGTSSLHRCPSTPEQDGQTLGVGLNGGDRLCLDGQRLVSVTGGYGAQDTEYRTEVDSYARIFQVGGPLTGNATCFRVEQKDGRILHYGAVVNGTTTRSCASSTANSRVQPSGAGATVSWLVEKIEDRAGNYETFAYHDFGQGEVLLQTVTYTLPDSGTVLDRTVTFAYQSRMTAPATCPTDSTKCATDVSSSYLAGGLTMQTQALASITTAVGGTTVRTYTPTYAAAAYSGRLLMTSLSECAWLSSTSACHPPTKFVYNDSALNFALKPLGTNIGLPAGIATDPNQIQTNSNTFSMISDLDGDGTREATATVPLADAIHHYLVQLTGDRAAQSIIDLTGTQFGSSSTFDFDADGSGRTALIYTPVTAAENQHLSLNVWKQARGYVYTPPANATPAQNFAALFQTYITTVPYSVSSPPHTTGQNVFVADLDADGKSDIILIAQSSSCGSDAVGLKDGVFFYRNTTSGTLSGTNAPAFTAPAAPLLCLQRTIPNTSNPSIYAEETIDHIADFDGDGIPDFYLVNREAIPSVDLHLKLSHLPG